MGTCSTTFCVIQELILKHFCWNLWVWELDLVGPISIHEVLTLDDQGWHEESNDSLSGKGHFTSQPSRFENPPIPLPVDEMFYRIINFHRVRSLGLTVSNSCDRLYLNLLSFIILRFWLQTIFRSTLQSISRARQILFSWHLFQQWLPFKHSPLSWPRSWALKQGGFPNIQARQLAEIDFYNNCDGLVQTPYQASHPGTANDVGVCVKETFNGLVVEWTASVTCEAL
jgi:hypothetical protein